jgi:predicted AAA+ superfamily ATPase
MTEDEVRTLGKLVAQLMREANERGMSIVEIDLDAARLPNVSDEVRRAGKVFVVFANGASVDLLKVAYQKAKDFQ